MASLGEDSSDDDSVDSLLDSDSDSEDDVASWALDSVRLFREQNVDRPAAQPASAADQLSARTSWASSFVLLFPSSTSRRAGRPVGSTPLRVRTVFFFEAVMFPLHCYPHIVLLLTPRVVSFSPPALIRSSQSTHTSDD